MDKVNAIVSSSATNRLEWVDACKGIGIFLVVVGHCNGVNFLQVLLCSYHMPLFFFLSGLFLSKCKGIKQTFVKKTKSLLVPLYVFSMILSCYSFCVARVSGADFSIVNRFIGMFVRCKQGQFFGSLWFLSCLFVLEILMLTLRNRLTNVKMGGGVIVVFSLIGYYLVQCVGVNSPWCIELVLVNAAFIYAGTFVAKLWEWFDFSILRVLVSGICFVGLAWWNFRLSGQLTDEYMNSLGVMPIFYMAAFAGIYITVQIGQVFHPKVLLWMGRNSLLIYCLHMLLLLSVNMGYGKIMSVLGISLPVSVSAVIKAVFVIAVLSPVIGYINRRQSWMLGRF